MAADSKKEYSQTADNALKIIACFSDREELGISELARELALSKASVSRLVAALERNGFLLQSRQTGKYQLGMALMMYGSLAKERNTLSKTFDPVLHEISEKYQTTTHMSIFSDGELVIINKISAGPLIYMSSRVGGTLTAYATAMGKCILAHYDAPLQEKLLAKFDYIKYTENTRIDTASLRRDLAEIYKRGYAVDDEEMHEGLFCVALPVLGASGAPLAAISTSGPKARLAPIQEEIASYIKRKINEQM